MLTYLMTNVVPTGDAILIFVDSLKVISFSKMLQMHKNQPIKGDAIVV